MPKNLLDEAKELIYGAREGTYGPPSINLSVIADLWSVYLRDKSITGRDVCIMMALLKLAREATGLPNRDNVVDAAGYLGLIDRLGEVTYEE